MIKIIKVVKMIMLCCQKQDALTAFVVVSQLLTEWKVLNPVVVGRFISVWLYRVFYCTVRGNVEDAMMG
jgi:hypothetical protein